MNNGMISVAGLLRVQITEQALAREWDRAGDDVWRKLIDMTHPFPDLVWAAIAPGILEVFNDRFRSAMASRSPGTV